MPIVFVPEGEELYHQRSQARTVGFKPGFDFILHDNYDLTHFADEEIHDAEGLLIYRSVVNRADIARFPNLKVLVRMGAGYDNVDRDALEERGILLCNVPDYGPDRVAHSAFTAASMLVTGQVAYFARSTPLDWTKSELPVVRRATDLTAGIVGIGRIGSFAAKYFAACFKEVVYFDIDENKSSAYARRVGSLEELLRVADVVSLHVPATPATHGMIGAAQISMMPQDAVLINTARGTVVDLDPLYDALKEGRFSGAAFDVLPGGDPPPDPQHKLVQAIVDNEPWIMGRAFITPHSAGRSPGTDTELAIKGTATVIAALEGQPINVITRDMY
ncbi:D-isomer specific 2-hydroxyacid dehydrogenase [Roridomyces roridus]|uniref:D-isomer specific 2-hydroxyacid dehydrogenase n=1 Tax=Roridomyces roridus TaxID=1738132 RepID=A0AAD7BBB8_9AGAR|nr:D-isomer specific 2-hydroxyacid dehydrogenase [Roridomyces roridus]